MKLFTTETIGKACRECNVVDLGKATIGEVLLVTKYLEQEYKIPFLRMEQGSPGLPVNRVGVEAEKRALDAGVGAQYPAAGGIKELKEAISEFMKAFVNVEISPRSCIPVTGSVEGSFGSFIACAQRIKGKDKVLFIDPGFPIQKSQLRILGIGWKEFDIYNFRGAKLKDKLEQMLENEDVAAIVYSNPNNPAWICLNEEELEIIGRAATKHDCVVMEDLAYFCMDFRKDLGHPYKAPFVPTVARYTDNYILMTSSSKIFSYAGQRIAATCISDRLYVKKYPDLALRYSNTGLFGPTLVNEILYMITSGCTASTQYGYAEMLRQSCEGRLNFVEDIREYERRAAKLKEIFCSNGFNVVYEYDVNERVGDGFFFTLGYKDMDSETLVKELINYGISSISLSTTGSLQKGIRACCSRIDESQYALLEERVRLFDADHQTKSKF